MACVNRKYHHTPTKYKYERRRRRFVSLVSALVWRSRPTLNWVRGLAMALKVRPLTAHRFQNYHDSVACVTHDTAVFSCGLSTDFLSPFSKAGNAMIIIHTDLLGSTLKLRFKR